MHREENQKSICMYDIHVSFITLTLHILKCHRGLVYVGQTKQAQKLKIVEHKTTIHTKNLQYADGKLLCGLTRVMDRSLPFISGVLKRFPHALGGGDIVNKQKNLLHRGSYLIYTLWNIIQ